MVWAGNNEDEAAVRQQWYHTDNYTLNQKISDYLILTKDTIGPIITDADPSRSFLLSSPSNGMQTNLFVIIYLRKLHCIL